MRFWIILIAMLIAAPLAHAKKVSLEWKEIKGAQKYEIQVTKDGNVYQQKLLNDTSWSADLPFGVYSYMIRAIDAAKRPGVWTQARALVVMPTGPEVVSPRGGKSVGLYNPSAAVTLKWKEATGATKYQVVVKRGGFNVLDQVVEGTSFDLTPVPPGEYTWNVTAILEGRGPAEVSGRKWESKPSDSEEFTVESRTLEAAQLVYPLGPTQPKSDNTVKFSWKSVDGAEGYELRVKTIKSRAPAGTAAPQDKVFIVNEEAATAKLPEGLYVWEVRAFANKNSKNVVGAIGPTSTASFELNRNSKYQDGGGYVALSPLFSVYDYSFKSYADNVAGTAKSVSAAIRLSGEYFFHPDWGAGGAYEQNYFTMNSRNYVRDGGEATIRHRMKLTQDKYGWFFYPKAGAEFREYFEIVPDTSLGSTATNVTAVKKISLRTMGPLLGIDIRKQLTERFSLGFKMNYFLPVMVMTSDTPITLQSGSYNSRNLSLGLQGAYWMGKQWAWAAGIFHDQRSISFKRGNAGGNEDVKMDANYFFGSLIYTFGK